MGSDVESTWNALVAGERAVTPLADIEAAGCRTGFAARVRGFVCHSENPSADRAVAFALHAAEEAVRNAGLSLPRLEHFRRDAAVVVGSSKGGVLRFASTHEAWLDRGASADGLDTFWRDVPPHAMAEAIARHFHIAGSRHCPVAACATGTIAVIRGAQMVADGLAEVVLCGATDASIHPLWLSAFERMGVLARPHAIEGAAGACRPFDRERCGFAIGEGAGMLVLESGTALARRRANPIARIRSWALGSDAADLTDADPDAKAIIQTLETALERASLAASQIDLLCAHGTGTRKNDAVEAHAWRTVMARTADTAPVTGVKGALGHLLGAAGGVETILAAEMLRRQCIVPTANHRACSEDTEGIEVASRATSTTLTNIVKVSLGFGGHIAVLILSRP